MKQLGIVLLVLLLFGCGVQEKQLDSAIDVVLNEIEGLQLTTPTNHRRDYFDYYLPKHIGKRFSDEDNAVFVRNNQEFYMYLDASYIIIDTYYKQLPNEEATSSQNQVHQPIGENIYERQGEMRNFHTSMRSYEVTVDKVGELYLLFVRYGALRFTALLPLQEIEQTIYDMFLIARSAKIDSAAVLSDYSNKSVVVITNKYDLFEMMFPEAGVIAHVVNQGNKGNIHEEDTTIPNDILPFPPGTNHEEPTGDEDEGAQGEDGE